MRKPVTWISGRRAFPLEKSKCKGLGAGACWTDGRSKEARMARAKEHKGWCRERVREGTWS